MPPSALRILVVDGEPQICRLLKTVLGPKHDVTVASTAATAIKRLASEQFDLVILELSLPDRNGLTVIEELRKISAMPVIVLSFSNDEESKVTALDLGADDYVTKPFGGAELAARVRVALRHRYQEQGTQPLLRFCDLEIDLVKRRVSRGGQDIKLSPTEYDILHLLAEHAGKILTHGYILRSVWGDDKASEVQYLRVYIRVLRRKLRNTTERNEIIRTEMGVGYRLAMSDLSA
jgi:two-component system, OmpR family, KDP operon response regulator KdpE